MGKNRAEVTCSLLLELNPDVQGAFDKSNFSSKLAGEASQYFSSFSLIIASNLEESLLTKLSNVCDSLSLPLVSIRAYGSIGLCRLQLSEHEIIESKPTPDVPDLRIMQGFEELYEYCHSVDLESLSDMDHAHMPYIVILTKALQEWKKTNANPPSNGEERAQFKQIVMGMVRYPHLIGTEDEEMNFTEAANEIFQTFRRRDLPEFVFEERNLSAMKLTAFSVLVEALRIFHAESGGSVPLNGTIPDLTSTTALFVKIQNVYQQRATKDRSRIREILQSLETMTTDNPYPFPTISDELIDIFCKNVYNLRLLSTTTISSEISTLNLESISEAVMDTYEDAPQTPILWYLALRAADRFYMKSNRYPGEVTEDVERDAEAVWLELQSIAEECSVGSKDPGELEEDGFVMPSVKNLLTKDHALEITRFGASEIHNIAALIGGIASQEVVKIITQQYVPTNNTYVHNGIAGVGGSYEL